MTVPENQPTLFGDEAPDAKLKLEGSRGSRITARQHNDIANGRHPLTREPLAGAPAGSCGECAFRVEVHGGAKSYPKCARPNVPLTHSQSSDVRAFWPACSVFFATSDLSEEQRDRIDAGEWPGVVLLNAPRRQRSTGTGGWDRS